MDVVTLDKDMTVVSFSLGEKVGLPEYSNVDIGPITIARVVENTKEAKAAAKAEILEELQEDIAVMRKTVLTAIREFAKSGGYGDVRNK